MDRVEWVSSVYERCSKGVMGSFKGVKGSFKKVSCVFQEIFKTAFLRVFQEYFIEVFVIAYLNT